MTVAFRATNILTTLRADVSVAIRATKNLEGTAQSAKKHLQDVLKISYQDKQDILPRYLADVQKMS